MKTSSTFRTSSFAVAVFVAAIFPSAGSGREVRGQVFFINQTGEAVRIPIATVTVLEEAAAKALESKILTASESARKETSRKSYKSKIDAQEAKTRDDLAAMQARNREKGYTTPGDEIALKQANVARQREISAERDRLVSALESTVAQMLWQEIQSLPSSLTDASGEFLIEVPTTGRSAIAILSPKGLWFVWLEKVKAGNGRLIFSPQNVFVAEAWEEDKREEQVLRLNQ